MHEIYRHWNSSSTDPLKKCRMNDMKKWLFFSLAIYVYLKTISKAWNEKKFYNSQNNIWKTLTFSIKINQIVQLKIFNFCYSNFLRFLKFPDVFIDIILPGICNNFIVIQLLKKVANIITKTVYIYKNIRLRAIRKKWIK